METNAKQYIDLIGKVYYVNIAEPRESSSGKTHQQYSFGLSLNNGASVFVNATIFNVNEKSPFMADKEKEYIEIIEKYEEAKEYNDEVFLRCRINPSKDGTMFGGLSHYEKEDGTLGMSIRGNVELVKHGFDDNEDAFIIFDTPEGKKEVPFHECEPKFIFQMILRDMTETKLELTDNEEYEKFIVGDLEPHISNKAVVGQGYKIKAKLHKGKIDRQAEHNKKVMAQYSWDEEISTTTNYAPDYFTFTPLGVVSGLSGDFETKKMKYQTETIGPVSKLPSELDFEDSFPF